MDAEGFLSQEIACYSIRPGAAAHTNLFVLADAAFASQVLRIAEALKHWRVFPNLPEACRAAGFPR